MRENGINFSLFRAKKKRGNFLPLSEVRLNKVLFLQCVCRVCSRTFSAFVADQANVDVVSTATSILLEVVVGHFIEQEARSVARSTKLSANEGCEEPLEEDAVAS